MQAADVEPTDEKIVRELIGTVLRIALRAMFSNFCYQWDGKYYLQMSGGPIGARITMSVATLVVEYLLEK